MLSFLTDREKEEAQGKGYMCEHLLCFYSMTSSKTALYDDNFPVYFSGYGEVDVILFGLIDEKGDKLGCVRDLLQQPLTELNVISSEAVAGLQTKYVDWDYHIDVERFDLDLRGREYKDLRYNVRRAERHGYRSRLNRTFTRAHAYVLSRHMARHTLDVWDIEELSSIERFFREHDHGFMMEAYYEDRLIGFDVIDFCDDNQIMVAPVGVYLEVPSLADFLMYENMKYAKEQGYDWLDVGVTCQNRGLQDFKTKWFAEPRYELVVQTIKRSRNGKTSRVR